MTSACGSLQSANIGSVTGSATYDACDSDTISISANNVPSSTTDKQYSVQREVCGEGEVIVQVMSVSGGLAGLELRASNAPGAIKVGLRTVLGTSVQRFVRTSTDGAQSSNNTTAVGHKWLKLVRSGSSVSTYTSQNGSSWNFAATYTISLPTCVQASLLVQSVNVNTTHTGVFKDLQFSGFTDPEGDPTTVSFDQDTISAEAGDTVMICVNIANPCDCSPTEVDVELQGSGSPHLSGYSTQALIFDDTSSQKCFSLPVSGAAGSSTYTFSLENLIGGNGAEAEEPETLVLEVTGKPLSFCGASFDKTEPHPDSVIVAYDRFGNAYTASDLEVVTIDSCPGTSYFKLNYVNIGAFTIEERETICEVFSDLAALISNPSGDSLQIQVTKKVLSPNILAQGSALYARSCEIGYPIALAQINGLSGVVADDEDSNVGTLDITSLVPEWHTLDEDPLLSSSSLYDLYSIVLHEALHILGIGSRIGITGEPHIGGYYSTWDLFLRTEEGEPLLVPNTDAPTCCNDYAFNSELGSVTPQITAFLNNLIDTCGGSGSIPKIVFNDNDDFPTVNGGNVGGTLQHLQALSHIDELCDGLSPGSYVMHPQIDTGQTRRVLHEVELNILRHLGYVVDDENETGEDCVIVAFDDIFNDISIVVGESVVIPFSFLLFNDLITPGATVTVSYIDELTAGAQYIEVESIDTDNDLEVDAFRITALPFSGLTAGALLVYQIEGCNGDCSNARIAIATLNEPVVPSCPNTGYCDNLVCNGDFEAYRSITNFFWAQSGLSPIFPDFDTSGNNSPDIAFQGPNSGSNMNQFIRLRGSESFYLPLERSIMPGCTLSLSYKGGGGIITQIMVSEHPPCLAYISTDTCLTDYPEFCVVDEMPGASYMPHCIADSIDLPGNDMSEGSSPNINSPVFYATSDIQWNIYQTDWVNNTGEPINWLIFHTGNVVRIDSIVATMSCPATVEIETEETDVCNQLETEVCFDVCVNDIVAGTEVELSVTVDLPPGFFLTSGNETTTLTFSENECQTVCLSVFNPLNVLNGEFDISIKVNQCGEVLDEAELPIVVIDCFNCEDCVGTNVIGTTNHTTLLSEVIGTSPGELPANGTNIQACIAGTLIIDQTYNFINSELFLLSGASIEIEDSVALSIVGSQLSGCDDMWRGIEVQKGGQLKIVSSLVSDAQYAVYVHPAEHDSIPMAQITLQGSAFANNFVSLFVPQTPYAKINAAVTGNFFIQMDTVLKPPYSGQTSAPESLPAQEDHALAGIIVNNLGSFSAYSNRFEGLTAGIVSNRTFLVAVGNSFAKILPYDNEYLTFDGRGTGINCRSNGSTTTMTRSNIFSNCSRGIVSNLTKLTAPGNTLTNVDWGILTSFANVGSIVIESNYINNAKVVGILVAHANPNGTVSISKNEVSTNSETDGVGIWLLGNNAPAILEDNNPIRVKGAGIGIGLSVSNRTELKGNVIKLENADMARAGIALAYAQNNALRNNTVLGFDISGEANENIGLEIASSPGNAYCCNTLNNTRLGVSVFGGSLTTDQFRGTTFGAHATSLYLPDVNAVLGTQTHTENCWQGNSGVAVYGVPLEDAQLYPFLVDQNVSLCFKPNSHSPEGWFEDDENLSGPPDICATSLCKTDGFKPDSDDVKRLTDGDTTLLPAVRWELQRYIYEKLITEAPGDTTNEKFRDNVENTPIGFFQAINENIAAMFAADSLSRAALNTNLILASGKLDSLILIDSLIIIEEDSSDIAELMQIRGGLTEVLFDLASDNEALTEEISDNFLVAAGDIRAVNDTITVVEDFEINEKVVNDLYLAYLAEANTSEIDTLEVIAAQCPLLGGNAVYRARALLAIMTGELLSYNDSLNCTGSQSFSRPDLPIQAAIHTQALQVFPNPATREVKVSWSQAILQSGSLLLYDLYGRKILGLILGEGETSTTVALPALPNSIYVLRLRLDGQDFVRKVSIKH